MTSKPTVARTFALTTAATIAFAANSLLCRMALGTGTIDAASFTTLRLVGLRDRMLDINIDARLSYDPATNTVFKNYAGMRVRNAQDVATIIAAVDRLLEPLRKRVNSIVNYEGFSVDDEAMDAYMDAVRYVEKKYYLVLS